MLIGFVGMSDRQLLTLEKPHIIDKKTLFFKKSFMLFEYFN